ncbi:MAG: NUDIX hydrolase [Patescibacteria group bacterium]|jgi:ADP-ribose pyrophosphatase YjhB (NUDIX family)
MNPIPPPIPQTPRPAAKPRRVYSHPAASHDRGSYKRTSNRRPIRWEVSAGGVVARQEHDQWLVALLKTEHKRGPVWILPKGHVEPAAGETVSDAAIREVQEEAGITSLSIKDQLGVTRYSFQAEEALVKKTVHYFLMTTDQKKLTPQAEENLIDAAWHPIDEAINCLEYDSDKNIMAKAREKLTGQRAQLIRRTPYKREHRATPHHRPATTGNPSHPSQPQPSAGHRPKRIHT